MSTKASYFKNGEKNSVTFTDIGCIENKIGDQKCKYSGPRTMLIGREKELTVER